MRKIRIKNAMKAVTMLAMVLICTTLLSGCRQWPINGKLDGQWQIMTIENRHTGEITTPEPRQYICFNLHVCNLWEYDGINKPAAELTYSKGDDSLSLRFSENNVTGIKNITILPKWGIYNLNVKFNILELDGKSLVLESDDSVLRCRRF